MPGADCYVEPPMKHEHRPFRHSTVHSIPHRSIRFMNSLSRSFHRHVVVSSLLLLAICVRAETPAAPSSAPKDVKPAAPVSHLESPAEKAKEELEKLK